MKRTALADSLRSTSVITPVATRYARSSARYFSVARGSKNRCQKVGGFGASGTWRCPCASLTGPPANGAPLCGGSDGHAGFRAWRDSHDSIIRSLTTAGQSAPDAEILQATLESYLQSQRDWIARPTTTTSRRTWAVPHASGSDASRTSILQDACHDLCPYRRAPLMRWPMDSRPIPRREP